MARLPGNLERLGRLERAQGRPQRAARLFGAAEAWRESQGAKRIPEQRVEYEGEIAALRADLGDTAFEEARAAGRELTFEAALALARED